MRDHIKDNLLWSIGDGEHVRIWVDPWVPSIPGFKLIPPDIGNQHSNLVWVKDLFRPGTKEWNIELLNGIFSEFEIRAIKDVHIPVAPRGDKLLWIENRTGQFTTKSLYSLLHSSIPSSSDVSINTNVDSFPWKKLRSVKGVSPRIIIFIWRLLHNGLAIRANTRKFVSSIITECPFCDNAEETIDHILLHCPFSQAIWFASPLELRFEYHPPSLSNLIVGWLNDNDNLQIFRIGVSILWCIWKARNKIIFYSVHLEIHQILNATTNLHSDYFEPISEVMNQQNT
ncbi:Reverse transcriptase zinc-binding domain [Macleaya cordata]|uniref:Reverse transcriptase zinc-binding domain n=1 Tax=Macleaya cordata TaxID=56857 RepID=A0A200QXY8_MACCD|nr:Reverse transcriptase zinc-binding domain [Macleaya cordata]